MFFGQEPKSDKDEEHAKKINENLNNPPTPGQSRAGAGTGGLGGLPPELASGLGGDVFKYLHSAWSIFLLFWQCTFNSSYSHNIFRK